MSYTVGEGPGGTSDAHTFTCGTWYSPLRVTSPAPGGLPVLTLSTQVVHRCPSAASLGRRDRASMTAEGIAIFVCVWACM